MNSGFVKLHRKMTEWEWYDDANTFRLFFHFIIKANFKDKQWRGITVKRGSFITGYDKLSQELKLSKQQIRTSIAKLKSTGEITHQATNAYSVVTLINYDSYQERELIETQQATLQPTVEQHSDNIRITPTKNVKNEKNVKNKKGAFVKPSPSEVNQYSLDANLNTTGFHDYYESNGWKVGGKAVMKDWQAAARGWSKRQVEYSKPKGRAFKEFGAPEIDFDSTGWSKSA